MSSAEIATRIVKNLESEDVRLLKVFASGLKHHEALTLDQLVSFSKLHVDVVNYRIKRLQGMGLVNRGNRGLALLTAGLDAFALKMLALKNIIAGIGKPIGVGKESDVFEAVNERQQELAIKFFRIGRISFRQASRKRGFSSKEVENLHHWLLVNVSAAKEEFDVLTRLKNTSVKIPVPLYRAMHCVVMNKVDGIRLPIVRELEHPRLVLQNILANIAIAYKNNVIHSDLSEYNVLVQIKTGEICIIDWPQAVPSNHPNAKNLLRRDVFNIVRFFNKRFSTSINFEDTLKEIINDSQHGTSIARSLRVQGRLTWKA
jgi:RIO kinase 2